MEFQRKYQCNCGRIHDAGIDGYEAKSGAVELLPEYVKKYNGTKAFVFADKNTDKAAGEKVSEVLERAGIEYKKYVFGSERLEPNEKAAGSLLMNYDVTCDIIIGVGSGVLNDLGKILAAATKNPYIIVATAPSMDGYASVTSSVVMDGVKWSIGNRCADVIIGDIDILKEAPERMIISGLGDMLAKYVAITDWRIANIITGEYYCETVADMVRRALSACVDNLDGLLKREPEAVKAVFEGLILSGMAMNYAGVTRVASGLEHSISHIWDMRGEEFGTATDFHGIQCAIGTFYAAKIYGMLRTFTPDREKALAYAADFDFEEYADKLREFIGKPAEAMIAREAVDRKYATEEHKVRLDRIIDNWDKILKIIDDEMLLESETEKILDTIKAPKTCEEIGIDKKTLPMTLLATKDIRDKYVLSRVLWDLGIIDEIEL